MATSYADSSQARAWDRRYDAWGCEKKSRPEEFHDYEAAELNRTQALADRSALQLAERKAAQVRINAAVEQIGDFFGLNGGRT